MKVAIIGAGNVCRGLTRSFVRTGQQVVITSRTPEKAEQVASEFGAQSAPTIGEAVRDADVVVVAVPFRGSAEEASRALAPEVKGKVVIDTTNPINETGSGLATEGGPSAAERIQSWLPGATVVKAFNTNFATVMANPTVHGEPADTFIAGDDEQAKATVARLAAEIGFRPVDVGALARAKELEALAFLSISIQATKHGSWNSAWKLMAAPQGTLIAQPAGQGAQTKS